MGIYDREYYRDPTRGLRWFAGPGAAVKTLILINVVVFIIQALFTRDRLIERWFAAEAYSILHQYQIWRLFTAPFLHHTRDILHIVFNMWFLWMVGREMESMYGSREFTFMYVIAGAFSTLCWTLFNEFGPDGGQGTMVGASGAVMAVLVIFTLYYPRREILFFFIPVQMWVVLLIYLGGNLLGLLQLLQGAGIVTGGPRTAFVAHLAGAAYGLAYWYFGWRWSRLFTAVRPRWPRLRVVRPPEPLERKRPRESVPTSRAAASGSSRAVATPTISEIDLDERLDEVLAKIAREGRDALNADDRWILEEASRRARSKRSERH
jgi:membrane associated rhomboid family serine protease